MIRMQIYLPEDLKQDLDFLARREGKAVAEVIRSAVAKEVKKKKRKEENAGTAMLKIADYAANGPGDISPNISDYLYGEKSDYSTKVSKQKAKWHESYVRKQKVKRKQNS